MKHSMLMAIAICSSLSMTPAVAGDGAEAALSGKTEDAAGVAAGERIGKETSTAVGDAEAGSSGAAVATEEDGKTESVAKTGSARGAAAGKPKRASTATAAGHIHNQVKKATLRSKGRPTRTFTNSRPERKGNQSSDRTVRETHRWSRLVEGAPHARNRSIQFRTAAGYE